jgi:hypothetical protein
MPVVDGVTLVVATPAASVTALDVLPSSEKKMVAPTIGVPAAVVSFALTEVDTPDGIWAGPV